MKTAAFWISPQGKTIEVPGLHITSVYQDPGAFGITKEFVDQQYKWFNEPTGTEGKARDEILAKVLEKGWIRVRTNINRIWTMQAWKLTKKTRENMWAFIAEIASPNNYGIKAHEDEGVAILELSGGKEVIRTTVKDVLSGKILEKLKKLWMEKKICVEAFTYETLSGLEEDYFPAVKLNKVLDEITKFGTLAEMSRGKIKISVDKNINKVGEELRLFGYKVIDDFPQDMSDESVNKWLNKNNIKAFFTKNYKHFIQFDYNRNYVLYGISSELSNKTEKELARIIEFIMMHHYKNITNRHLHIINNDLINRIKENENENLG